MMELIPQVDGNMEATQSRTGNRRRRLRSRIEAMEKRTPEKELGKEVLQDAYEKLSSDFDQENGGFGWAPKFPRPHSLMFLLR